MEISLRSQLTAGVVFVGAAAIAVTPIVVPDVLPSVQRVTANIQNTAFVDPLSTLGQSLGLLGQWVFGTGSSGTPLPLDPNDPVGTPSFLAPNGVIPQLINGTELYFFDPLNPDNPFSAIGGLTGTPLLSQIGINMSNYALAGVGALQGITDATGALLFGVPLAAFSVISALINGETPDIAAIIQDTIITPITNAVTSVVDAVTFVATNVINNSLSLLTSLPTLAIAAVTTAVSGLVYTGTQLLNTVTTAIGDLATLNLEGAWNTTMEGLLGPTGLVGNLLNLSIGQGVGELGNPDNPFIPSLRQTLTGATINGALSIGAGGFIPPQNTAGPVDGAAVPAGNARTALSAAAATKGGSPGITSIKAEAGSSTTGSAPSLQNRLAAPAASDPAPGVSGAAADSTKATATDAVDNTAADNTAVAKKAAATKAGSAR